MSGRDLSRRAFLHGLGLGGAVIATGAYGVSITGPPAGASPTRHAGDLGDPRRGRTLVVLELAGGNDGLNTVVPMNDGTYHDLRPTLGVADAIDVDGEIGLHPELARLAQRYADDQVAIVEGLGYPEPDLSHFGSIAIWWSARGGAGRTGWLGAYLDGTVGFDDPLAAIGIGPSPSPALTGRSSFATTIADGSGLEPRTPTWLGSTETLLDQWADTAGPVRDASTLTEQVSRAVGLTVAARTDLARSLTGASRYDDEAQATGPRAYQDRTATESLALAAELTRSPNPPAVIYISGVGDYDTHQGQAERHPALLADVDAGIDGFFSALGERGRDAVIMTASEFGRRPGENGSGTDHGTANEHFLIGPNVRGGRYGERPSLSALDRGGNLVHTADFRSLYATVLEGWLDVDAEDLLGGDFERFEALR